MIQPVGAMQAAAATRRTVAQMQKSEIQEATRWEPDDAGTGRAIPFRSTLDADTYKALKAEHATERVLGPLAAAAPGREAFLGPAALDAEAATVDPVPLAPPVFTACGITGADQFGTIRPPDTHGAIGRSHFVEIVNTRLHVFNRFTCAPLLNVSLNAFFGIPAGQPILFDPRAVYDPLWNRWVLSAEQFPLSATDQRQIIAISTGPSALGPYIVYNFNVHVIFGGSPDFFWDFPQLGMNQDAVIVTANIFNPGFVGSATFAVAKARLYNGLGFSVPLFFLPAANPALVAPSLAPPIVLDQAAHAVMVSAAPVDNEIRKFTFVNPCCPPNQFLAGPVSIPVPVYTVPANACQPGMADRLDTLDSRFVNASTQVGNLLYNVHTIALGPFPTPRWYRIDTAANTALPDFFFESAISHDFNASIAANVLGDVFVTWSTTDCGVRGEGGHHARIRWSGDDFPLPIDIGPGFPLFTSPVGYNPSLALDERWGDYSAVSLDPLNLRRAWIVNEKINAPAVWGSRFLGVGFVPFP